MSIALLEVGGLRLEVGTVERVQALWGECGAWAGGPCGAAVHTGPAGANLDSATWNLSSSITTPQLAVGQDCLLESQAAQRNSPVLELGLRPRISHRPGATQMHSRFLGLGGLGKLEEFEAVGCDSRTAKFQKDMPTRLRRSLWGAEPVSGIWPTCNKCGCPASTNLARTPARGTARRGLCEMPPSSLSISQSFARHLQIIPPNASSSFQWLAAEAATSHFQVVRRPLLKARGWSALLAPGGRRFDAKAGI
jgi:hypothetical protein